jgi:mevalonate kinase
LSTWEKTRGKIGGFDARLVSDIPIGKVQCQSPFFPLLPSLDLTSQGETQGMASSGAVTVGLVRALNELFALGLDATAIAGVAYLAEHEDLGIPCGRMDQYAIATGGVTHVWTGDPPITTALCVPLECEPLAIVVGDTLEPRPLHRLLTEFRAKLAAHDPLTEEVFAKIAECVEGGRKALEEGDLEAFGRYMRAQMDQERRVGCITAGLDRLCKAAETAGAYGAKLTGVGGGGCMVALCRPGKQQAVADAITEVGGKAWIVSVVSYAPDGSFRDHTPHPETL